LTCLFRLTAAILDACEFFLFLFLFAGGKFETSIKDNAYKVHMNLTIKSVSQSDFGSYMCVAKNSLGETDGTIKLYSWVL